MKRLLLAAAVTPLLWASAFAEPPAEPRVVESEPGKHGGDLRMMISRSRDVRLFNVYGYARLVEYDRRLEIVPDILAALEEQDERVFTLRLRQGHKWSDGQPFTAEDFRFYWEDVALNPALSPVGPDIQLLVGGERPRFEVIDERTVRFTWSKPNPFFVPALAATTQLFIYRPAHYLKQFHEKYQDPAKLAQMVADTQSRDWAQLFLRRDRLDNFDNPEMPTLQPWMQTTAPPAERFVGVRNPYFHRVDVNRQQLPYIDRLIMDVVDSKLVPIKTGAGETDLQSRHLAFKDYTFLKDSQARNGLKTTLWREARGSHLAIFPNLNANDPVWRGLFRDRRFREALSLAVDRDAINQYLYYGLAEPANNTITPDSPLWSDEVGTACAGFDVERANALLDEIGLTERNDEDLRLLPDGRPLELVVETAGEDTEQSDVLELVRDQWMAIGLRIFTKPTDDDVLDNRIFSGESLMTISYGIDNGVPTAQTPPKDFAPTSQADQLQWPKWGQYYETSGAAGEAPDLPEAKRLMELFEALQGRSDEAGKTEAWREMLTAYAGQCWTIGTVRNVMQPVAARAELRNVPEDAVYNWEPHGQFGIYLPDTFWYAR